MSTLAATTMDDEDRRSSRLFADRLISAFDPSRGPRGIRETDSSANRGHGMVIFSFLWRVWYAKYLAEETIIGALCAKGQCPVADHC